MTVDTTYRKAHQITAADWLAALEEGGHYGRASRITQHALFVRVGGDPNDRDYARMSYRTQELRESGVGIGSDSTGIWLDEDSA